jgi:hypothetical protein
MMMKTVDSLDPDAIANSEYTLSNRLAWVGLSGAFLFGAIEYFGSPNSTGLTFQIAQS